MEAQVADIAQRWGTEGTTQPAPSARPGDPPQVTQLAHSVTRAIALAPMVAGAAGSRHAEGTIPEEAGWALTAAHTLFSAGPLLGLAHC